VHRQGASATTVERLLSVREACEALGISSQSFYRLVGRSELPVVKIGGRTLIRPSELDALVRRSERTGEGDRS
jgi:excisionase family DNA binding protein